MTLARIEMVLRLVGGAIAALAVAEVARTVLTPTPALLAPWPYLLTIIIATGAVVAFVVAFALTPALTTRPFLWALGQATEMPASDFLAAAVGAVVGLLVGVLVAIPLSYLPWYLGSFLPIAASLALAYLGVTAVLTHKKDLLQLVRGHRDERSEKTRRRRVRRAPASRSSSTPAASSTAASPTSARPASWPARCWCRASCCANCSTSPTRRTPSGGRAAAAASTSSTSSRRTPRVPLVIHEEDGEPGVEVDALLVMLARQLRCPIVTNDYNLNRVAGLQGVKVLNVNELANAVKSIVLPGQELSLKVIQEGKEVGQGVGYLEDGTMVVVENGRRAVGSTVTVMVSRVLQTAAGRMVFAQTRSSVRRGRLGVTR